MVDAGLSSVTMIQRRCTCKFNLSFFCYVLKLIPFIAVIPAELYKRWTDSKDISFKFGRYEADLVNSYVAYYNDQTPIETADRQTISLPVAISRQAAMLRY